MNLDSGTSEHPPMLPLLGGLLGGSDEQPPVLTGDEFLALVIAHMHANRVPASAAVDALLSEANLTDEAWRAAARVGFAYMAGNQEHRARIVACEPEEDAAPESPHRGFVNRSLAERVARADILMQSMAGADGYKPLLAFTVADWNALANDMGGKARAFQQRKAFAKEAAALLAKHKVETVEGLPARALAQFRAKATEVWSA
jgi:hypothetical protein